MNEIILQQFIQLIADRIGLQIRVKDWSQLIKKINMRIKALKLSTYEKYYELLNNPSISDQQQKEWKELTQLLTVGESYFFRDKGQLNIVKNKILPNIIDAKRQINQAASHIKPSLRIWCAGCSTGEEPYSLAILIKELIPDWQQWNLLILGTDINSESLTKARKGIYSNWSFRQVEPQLKKNYFYPAPQNMWQIDESIRKIVTFRTGNLIQDNFPNLSSDLYNMDLIICRNVFIYFGFDTVATVIDKFYNTLAIDGYLMTGHAELDGQNLSQFQTLIFPESIIYQRCPEDQRDQSVQVKSSLSLGSNGLPTIAQIYKPAIAPAPQLLSGTATLERAKTPLIPATSAIPVSLSQSPVSQELVQPVPTSCNHQSAPSFLAQAEAAFQQGNYAIAIQEAEQALQTEPRQIEIYDLIAQAFANLGNHAKAIDYCNQALTIEPFAINPHYLLAHIFEEQGNSEQAKELFKKIIYLSPTAIAAYLELGALYETEGDTKRAQKMWQTALELLRKLPSDTPVEHQDSVTAQELITHVKKRLLP
jgi:chemotaxis protein methyltransferase CheR